MKKMVIAVITAISLAGCNGGTTGIISQNLQNIDVEKTTKKNVGCDIYMPLLLTAGPAAKEESSVMNIAKQKGINTITYVDYNYNGIFPFFMKKCYTVYGY